MGDPVKHLALLRGIREYVMPPHEKAFMLSLCLFGDEDGTNIRPSQQTIATLHQLSWRRAAKIYQSLKEKGYIIEDGWHKRCRKWRINTKLFLPEPAKKEKPVVPVSGKSKPVKAALSSNGHRPAQVTISTGDAEIDRILAEKRKARAEALNHV